MSFQVPQNVPSFNSGQRSQEDLYWRHKQSGGGGQHQHNVKGGIAARINGIFADDKQQLPMYKDKPNLPSSGWGRRRFYLTRGRMLSLLLLMAILSLWWTGTRSPATLFETGGKWEAPYPSSTTNTAEWEARREAVKEVFITSWDGYEKYAWGLDEYNPLSRQGRNMVEGGMGWIIVDALDTAIMMNLTSRVARAREWISTSLSYTANHDVNTFETTIRMLGGLLSAHYLSTTYPHLAPLRDDDVNQPGEDLYIEKATDLADRLLGAYETPSGIPHASVNLNLSMGIPSTGDGGASSTAEAGTLQLEMKYLSKLTGEPIYWQRAERVIKAFDDQHREDGLLPIFIHPSTGEFRSSNIRLGSRGDSYYEYLIKQYLQTSGGEPVYLELWNEALDGVKKHLITYSKYAGLTILAERQNGLHLPLTAKMDHLACFMPGTIALAMTEGSTVSAAKSRLGTAWNRKHDQDLMLAQELMKTCWGMYKVNPTGLAPEIAYFRTDDPPKQWHGQTSSTWSTPTTPDDLSSDLTADWRLDYDIHANDVHNLQRPETVESLFYMYRITGDPKYREWGWTMFESFREHTKVVDEVSGKVYAYASLDTVMENPVKERRRRDNMESFWLAETLKYFYLLFSDEAFFPLDQVVINTEAHFFPRFDIRGSKIWKTGWTRDVPRKKGIADQGRAASPLEGIVVGGGVERQAAGDVRAHGIGSDNPHIDEEEREHQRLHEHEAAAGAHDDPAAQQQQQEQQNHHIPPRARAEIVADDVKARLERLRSDGNDV